MNPDQLVCLCFRVSRRRLEKFLRIQQPTVASRLSECEGAGTGCGWCVPYLKQFFEKSRHGGAIPLDTMDADAYVEGRSVYRATGERTIGDSGEIPPDSAPE